MAKFKGFHALELSLNKGAVVRVAGLNRGEASVFAAKVNSAWRSAFAEQIDAHSDEFVALSVVIEQDVSQQGSELSVIT